MENPQKAFNNGDGIKLRDYLEQAINSVRETIAHLRETINIRLAAMEEAIDLAAEVIRARLETMNEWRGTIDDILNKVIIRTEYDSKIGAIDAALNELRLTRTELATKEQLEASVKQLDASMVALKILMQQDNISIKKDITDLLTYKAVADSKASQMSVWIGYGISFISLLFGLIGTVIGIVSFFINQ